MVSKSWLFTLIQGRKILKLKVFPLDRKRIFHPYLAKSSLQLIWSQAVVLRDYKNQNKQRDFK